MLTEKDYCDYETCVALKELGCSVNNECFQSKIVSKEIPLKFFDTTLQGTSLEYAPIISLYEAQKWLREEKEVYVTVIPEYNEFVPIKGVKYRLEVAYWKDDEFGYATIEWLDDECPHTIITFDSYEEALSEGIKEAIKILKEK